MQKMFSRCRGLLQWRNYSWSPAILTLCLVSLASVPGIVQGQDGPVAQLEQTSDTDGEFYFSEDGESYGESSRPLAFFVGILFGLGVLVLSMAYFYLWISQLVQLMIFSDKDFPGRSDKTLWLIIYIFFAPIAPFIFMWWKKAYLHVRHLEQNQ